MTIPYVMQPTTLGELASVVQRLSEHVRQSEEDKLAAESTHTDLIGTNTNDNAESGYVGEYVSSNIASGAAISLTSAATANITSISLTAGDWDVIGHVYYSGGATTNVQRARQSISTTSATMNQTNGNFTQIAPQALIFAAGDITAVPVCAQRISIAATTTVYLVAQAIFTISTCSVYGFIQARRVR